MTICETLEAISQLNDNKDIERMLDYIQERATAMSHALKERRWILVEEDVTDKECLCCNERGFIMIGFLTKDGRSTTGYAARSDFEIMLDIVAWQPLPAPYVR